MPTEYAWFPPTGQYGGGHRINAKEAEIFGREVMPLLQETEPVTLQGGEMP